MDEKRLSDLKRFYELLHQLEKKRRDKNKFSESQEEIVKWPKGIYFFFENGEERRHTGTGPRVVRIGKTLDIWNRLYQHKGTSSGSGDHRTSSFRSLVGSALMKSEDANHPFWGLNKQPLLSKMISEKNLTTTQANQSLSPSYQSFTKSPILKAMDEIKTSEKPLEKQVSEVINKMPFLWLAVENEPSPDNLSKDLREHIELNAIALLSNFDKEPLDPPSDQWLGRFCNITYDRVRKSGLWNRRHLQATYNHKFLDQLDQLIKNTE